MKFVCIYLATLTNKKRLVPKLYVKNQCVRTSRLLFLQLNGLQTVSVHHIIIIIIFAILQRVNSSFCVE